MAINGISIKNEDGCVVCYVDEFSNEFKQLIKEEIGCICYGKQRVDEDDLGHYSYKRTLADFLKRYCSKNENTKKGMMGEFIAHLVISNALENLKAISIFFNKEELSIKKGFDLNYIDMDGASIWYGEVKSGEVAADSHPDKKNTELLGEAKSSLSNLLSGGRPSIWDSVIVDAKLCCTADESKKVGDLLKMDISQIGNDPATKKNAILISVLFHDVGNKISSELIKHYLNKVKTENVFANIILFSIQKSTYKKIEDFLSAELTS